MTISKKQKIEKADFISNYETLYVIEHGLENISLASPANGNHSREIKAKYNRSKGEKVIKGDTNAFISIGRDRNSGTASGMGGKGFTGAAAIDIVAGLGGARPIDRVLQQERTTDKDFENDAARIYLSQMSDIDEYFSIPKIKANIGPVAIDLDLSTGTSAIGIKADNVRVISRESIKLVTKHRGLNSLNKKSTDGGVDIMAGYNIASADPQLSLQPMVKGNNLLELLKEMINSIEDVQSTVASFMKTQKKINDALSAHIHITGAVGTPTSPIVNNKILALNFKLATQTQPDIIRNFVKQGSISGEFFNASSAKFINSLWNRVN